MSNTYANQPVDWVGNWGFVESWPGPQGTINFIATEIIITKLSGRLIAYINQDGFMKKSYLRATAKMDGDSIKIFYLRTSGEYHENSFKPGELLIELKIMENNVITIWHGLQPTLDEHKKPGPYFVKS